MREQCFHRVIKSVDYWSATDQLSLDIRSNQREVKSERERGRWIFFVGLEGNFPIRALYVKVSGLIVRVSIFLHSRFLSLNRLGFGCVGLASAQTLVGPRRLGGASYHSIRRLFWGSTGNLKLRHYPVLRVLDLCGSGSAYYHRSIPLLCLSCKVSSQRMKKIFQLLNAMVRDGEVSNYAIGGAIAAVFYVEPFSTLDIDVFVMMKTDQSGLVTTIPGWDY